MAFINNYIPESEILEHEWYGPDPYRHNPVLPIPPRLSTHKLRLVPTVPRVHAATFIDGVRGHEAVFKHMPAALERPSDMLRCVEKCRRSASALLFAAIDTTGPDTNHFGWEGFFPPSSGCM